MNKRVLCSVRFRAAGDVMVHQRQLDCALQLDGSYDFHLPFQQVKELLGNADYTIANLKPLSERENCLIRVIRVFLRRRRCWTRCAMREWTS